VLRRFDAGERSLLVYPADELEAGPANLYLRVRGREVCEAVPLLGPGSPSEVGWGEHGPIIRGEWRDLHYSIAFRLADGLPSWFWHVWVKSLRSGSTEMDLVYAQDLALTPYDAVRTNEYYVSQYLDLTPIETSSAGTALAVRQNMPGPTAPWAVVGCLTEGVGWATDALQLFGRGHLAGDRPAGLSAVALPNKRLQHEHALVVLQARPVKLAEGETTSTGFFGVYVADHPAATSGEDTVVVDQVLSLPEALTPPDTLPIARASAGAPAAKSLFSSAGALTCTPLAGHQLTAFTGEGRHHTERDGDALLSYFTDEGSHIVTNAKQASVLRPHGHLMRTGTALVPDERSLTTTAWMAGTFHSQVTQGHAGQNRMLSIRRSYLALRQAHGLRAFIEWPGAPHGWALLDEPSAWAVGLDSCRWWYRHEGGVLEVVSSAPADSHELGLKMHVVSGAPVRFLICAHVALGGDDGQDPEPPSLEDDEEGVTARPPQGTPMSARFPNGSFRLSWAHGAVERVGRDEALFLDGQSRRMPWITLLTSSTTDVQIRLTADLVPAAERAGQVLVGGDRKRFWDGVRGAIRLQAPSGSPLAAEVARLDAILPWFAHDALIHYLSPRGLEQFSGGAWGTRDVCQGPVSLLIALGETAPLRDVVLRILRGQNARGDWPQWFEFFPREFRGGQRDSHGDVVYWPLLAVGEYLAVTADSGLLGERIPFVGDDGATADEPVLEHVRRALTVIANGTVPGTSLPAYGHGDWNDSLQPADPHLAAHLCSTWTATLRVHALRTLARSLRTVGPRVDGHGAAQAIGYADQSERVADETADAIHSLLMKDGLLAGYGLFGTDGSVEHLVHPSDRRTGLSYGVLQIIHAISGDLLSPAEAREHLDVLQNHLLGPDGARLFDRPARYHGGPMEVFQRAEASTFFGREIGLMYTHAHLRYAEALARYGDAERLLRALALANPIGVTDRVTNARLRQSTCYYSSSDATFADRYEAAAHYEDVIRGRVPLEGGWRVYSSGPGIFLRLVLECLLGVRLRGDVLEIDPMLPPTLDGLQASVPLKGSHLELAYRVGGRETGTVGVTLNGVPLKTTPLVNPYRPGGVSVDMERLEAVIRPKGKNQLEIQVA
jgi:CRISPR-associated protein Csx3